MLAPLMTLPTAQSPLSTGRPSCCGITRLACKREVPKVECRMAATAATHGAMSARTTRKFCGIVTIGIAGCI
jgi:hypothetical protein